jgi:hypothetical protein
VLVNGHIYCINDAGLGQVVALGEKPKIVATSEFGTTILSSPAVAENAMFVRSDSSLWKVTAHGTAAH